MAARVDPRHVRARHQSMHHFVAECPLGRRRPSSASPATGCWRRWLDTGPVAAWIVDDTAYPEKGRHSVGVARQYCGPLGKQDNCQVAVSVSLANEAVSLPVSYRLYLPESWAQDRRRRAPAGVPDAVEFQPKWQLALAQIRTLQAEAVPPAPVVADAGYGDTTAFREALTTAGFGRMWSGSRGETTVWRPGQAPLPPKRAAGRPRPPVDPCATDRSASAGEPQALGGGTARLRVADRDVA